MSRLFKTFVCSTALLTCLTVPAAADEAALRQEVEDLRARLTKLEAMLKKVDTKVETAQNTANSAKASAGTTKVGDVNIAWSNGHPKFSNADGSSTLEIHGRMQLDAQFFDDDMRDYPDGTDLRRLWVGVKGKVANDFGYAFVTDLSASSTIQDAFISYDGIKNTSFKLGNQTTPYMLEQQTGNLHQAFLERSLVHDAFYSGRLIGLTGHTWGDNWSFKGGVYGAGGTSDGTDDEQYSVGAGATFVPVKNETTTVHLGIAPRYAVPEASSDSFTYDAKPEASHTSTFRAVDTGAISSVDDTFSTSLEGLVLYKNVSLQAEYTDVSVDRFAGSPDADFDGYYVQASWFPTGENRSYSVRNGAMGRVVPNRDLSSDGWGAWELAVRYSAVDLTDANINGGEADTLTFSVGWYPYSNLRLLANYVMADVDNTATQTSDTVANDDVDIFGIRAQVDF